MPNTTWKWWCARQNKAPCPIDNTNQVQFKIQSIIHTHFLWAKV